LIPYSKKNILGSKSKKTKVKSKESIREEKEIETNLKKVLKQPENRVNKGLME
jgi:hypothetical protein